ncbi:hypothetical protein [Nesterenkonia sp.]|uniref:MGH1-like glycoside hydrolase domain-containing protein n=1 Tax=Nesterenkonia sp. TaxID=704201 RepID=UPI0026127D39|nr:hypothetical protein [Nesterenkonia sp.]
MSVREQALTRLRRCDPATKKAGLTNGLAEQISASGVGFVALGGPLEERWHQAVAELQQCVRPLAAKQPPVLLEGTDYPGCWLESTGTISAEVLYRFAPDTAQHTISVFAGHQRAGGLLPYKVTDEGPAFTQIQLVTPLARSVWNHYRLHRPSRRWLQSMYSALGCADDWLATFRDTRGTGCVEAFCTFDTGHDLSPRFWQSPDRCLHGDAAQCDPEAVQMPYLAPDLTAHQMCQRSYLGRMAAELGEDPAEWRSRAEQSRRALFQRCFSRQDGTFYDVDAYGRWVRVLSDVLLRVLACEAGDDELFDAALGRYLLHTAHFLSAGGLTSLSLSDPRYDSDYRRNSWAGPVNMLTQLRAPHAFEHHGRHAELGLISRPVLSALAAADRFCQCLDPHSGQAGHSSGYSPAMLWLLDAVERWFGVMPLPGDGLAFTSLAPTRLGGSLDAEAVAYSRTVGGHRFELVSDDAGSSVHRSAEEILRFPRGWRVLTDAQGRPHTVVAVAPHRVAGVLEAGGQTLQLSLEPNELVQLRDMRITGRSSPGFTAPNAA